MRRRPPLDPAPGSLRYELTQRERDAAWLVCCQSSDRDGHRFDCREAGEQPRGEQYGPVRR